MGKIDIAALVERLGSSYPSPHDVPCRTRAVRRLGDAGGLTQFGVNLVRLPPGAWSSQRHWHTREDELVYVLAGDLVLVTDAGEQPMGPGDCAAFPAGSGDGHRLHNRGSSDGSFLAIGTRDPLDRCEYSDLDMIVDQGGFRHRDGRPY